MVKNKKSSIFMMTNLIVLFTFIVIIGVAFLVKTDVVVNRVSLYNKKAKYLALGGIEMIKYNISYDKEFYGIYTYNISNNEYVQIKCNVPIKNENLYTYVVESTGVVFEGREKKEFKVNGTIYLDLSEDNPKIKFVLNSFN